MLALFRNRYFSFLWIGQFFSQFGDRLTQIILVALVATRASGSTLSLAKVLAVTSLPALLLNPFAGVYVDRWNRKWIMVVCDLIRAGAIAGFPWLASFPSVVPLHGGIFLVFAVATFFVPARLAIIPDLVSKNQLAQANALFSSSGMIGSTVTLLLGALLVEWIGATAACYVNAGTYFLSALFILPIIPKQRKKHGADASVRRVFEEVKEGLRHLWTHKETRRVIFLLAFLMGGAGASIVLGTVLIQQMLGSVTKDIGIFSLWAGVGMLIGAVAYGRWGTKVMSLAVLALSFCGAGSAIWVFLVAVAGLHSREIASGAVVLLGFWIAPAGIIANTMVHEGHGEHLHGRIFSSLGVVVNCAFMSSMLITGALAEKGNRPLLLGIVGAVFVLSGLILLCYTRRRRQQIV